MPKLYRTKKRGKRKQNKTKKNTFVFDAAKIHPASIVLKK
jgi:hypothetical protein